MGYGVLIIEDEAILAKNIKLFPWTGRLRRQDCRNGGRWHRSIGSVQTRSDSAGFQSTRYEGLECLETVRAIDSTIKVMIITGHGNVELAVNAMKAGAYDFLTKPLSSVKATSVAGEGDGEERQAPHVVVLQGARRPRKWI
jgi:DNA-binding NtrC family response regulator